MLHAGIFLVAIIVSVFMALKRYKNNDKYFATAWFVCALINVYFFAVYLTQPTAG